MRTLIQAGLIAAVLAVPSAWAQDASPVGLWKTVDDETGKPKALVRITENGGELQGRIEKLFREPNEEQNPKCLRCDGANKDQPIVGMVILSGLKKDGDAYAGGRILDPKDGKVYKSKLSVTEGGKQLDLRAYLGVPLVGRTQKWLRQE